MPQATQELKLVGILATLRSCQLFSGIPLEELKAVSEFTVIKAIEKGQYLFHEGDPAQGFYIVQSGAINVHRVNAMGKEQVIHVFRPGDSFAEAALATPHGYPADARAVTSSLVLLVKKAGILSLVQRKPELALRMLGSMSTHLRVLVSQLEDLTLKDVETRLAHWLVKRCGDTLGQTRVQVEIPGTKRALAAELGTAAETLSRTLADFRNQGLIQVKGKSVTILNPSRLSDRLRRNLGE